MTKDKIERGIVAFIDSEIVPQISEGMTIGEGRFAIEIPVNIKKALVGTAGAVLSKKASGMLEEYFPSADGVDLYALKCELMKRIGDEPFPMSIGGIIDATFTKGDIEKLYGYIERA